MIVLTLLALAVAALVPLALPVLRFGRPDPVLVVGGAATVALGVAGLAAWAARDAGSTAIGWAAVLAVGAAATGGSPVVRSVFRLMRREFVLEQRDDQPAPALRGGTWIGYLERVAVAVAVLTAVPEGIAFVLAVKGVGRYAELRETNAPEAFIIGTMSSMLWAVGCAGAALLLR